MTEKAQSEIEPFTFEVGVTNGRKNFVVSGKDMGLRISGGEVEATLTCDAMNMAYRAGWASQEAELAHLREIVGDMPHTRDKAVIQMGIEVFHLCDGQIMAGEVIEMEKPAKDEPWWIAYKTSEYAQHSVPTCDLYSTRAAAEQARDEAKGGGE